MIVLLVVLFVIVTIMKRVKGGNQASQTPQAPSIAAPTGVSRLARMNMSQALTTDDGTVCDPNGGVFTGEVWSDDNRTFCMRVANGKTTNMLSYHDNGRVAIDHRLDGTDEGANDVYTFYDDMGNIINEDTFNARYQSVWDRMEQQWPQQ